MNTTPPPTNETPKPHLSGWKIIWPVLASVTGLMVIATILCELAVHKMINRDNTLLGFGAIFGALVVIGVIGCWKAYKQ